MRGVRNVSQEVGDLMRDVRDASGDVGDLMRDVSDVSGDVDDLIQHVGDASRPPSMRRHAQRRSSPRGLRLPLSQAPMTVFRTSRS